MHLTDAKGSHRAIRFIGLVMALAGLAIMIGGFAVGPYLAERDQEIYESLSPDDPNWLYYHSLGDAVVVVGLLFTVGGGLLITSLIIAILYYLSRRGVTYKLIGNLDRLKLKGSNVE